MARGLALHQRRRGAGDAAANEARRQQRQRAQTLAASLQPALRKELLDLIAKGQRIEAIKRYQEASKEDLSTSRAVVEAIK